MKSAYVEMAAPHSQARKVLKNPSERPTDRIIGEVVSVVCTCVYMIQLEGGGGSRGVSGG